MSSNTASVSFYTRLETLKKKHAMLDRYIAKQQRDPSTADFYIKQLKRQKLLLKDQMEDLMGQLRRKSANAL
jgi:hypothetical protein